MSDFHLEVYKLITEIEENQYKPRDFKSLIPRCGVMTRADLQKIEVDKTKDYVSTSGSTGEPVNVQKFYAQQVWYAATNIRELLWMKWDVKKTLAIINAPSKEEYNLPWLTNPYMFGLDVGKVHTHPTRGDLQKWLDDVKPDYLHSYPSIISTLDISKLKGVKSTGERGATNYSSEELGTIALTCPDNPDVYHIMENILVEIDKDNNIIATDLTHPYIKRYKIGDKGEFATCSCGRKLQTLKRNVVGRVRNMVKYPDGTTAWPLFGTHRIKDVAPEVKRVQAIQETLNDIVLKVQGNIPIEKREDVKNLVINRLGHSFNIKFDFVDEFTDGKFEEFVCKI